MLKTLTILLLCTQEVKPTFSNNLHIAAATHELEAGLLLATVATESRCEPTAHNPDSGALGYGQIIPRWWKAKATELGYKLVEPADNLKMTAYILKKLTSKFTLREAIRRYYGYRTDKPGSWERADAYATSVLNRYKLVQQLESQ